MSFDFSRNTGPASGMLSHSTSIIIRLELSSAGDDINPHMRVHHFPFRQLDTTSDAHTSPQPEKRAKRSSASTAEPRIAANAFSRAMKKLCCDDLLSLE